MSSRPRPFFALKSKNVYSYRPIDKKGIYTLNKSKEINFEYFKNQILINSILKNGTQSINFNLGSVDGLYTWLVKESGNFYTARIREGQEMGTLHTNIDYLTFDDDPSNVIAAGEIEKIGDTLKFNFASGSYMKTMTINNDLIERIKALLTSFGFTHIDYKEDPKKSFINLENDRLKPKLTSNNNTNRIKKLNKMYGWTPKGGNHKKRLTKHNRKHQRKHRRTHKK